MSGVGELAQSFSRQVEIMCILCGNILSEATSCRTKPSTTNSSLMITGVRTRASASFDRAAVGEKSRVGTMGKKKMSKREVRQAEHTCKKRELRDMAREDRRSEMVRSAQVSVSYQCVERMHLLRPRARTRCALVCNFHNSSGQALLPYFTLSPTACQTACSPGE